ncbi:hypothetical protein FFWV33_06550 [Flavobacterium faecale]|uniref:Uncharacterized protein n=1 Tax=Flavobacterium faecale TaxID=1355330 RepID=A0A2S1LBZ1_9FLAO|nr:hypothetical protein [Flavobacterium faecale]AWG21218.1 hypothetical protein FFWV33_06550 [Flavobacterium faecale]
MNKAHFVIGLFIGLATSLIGCFLFVKFYTEMDFINGIQTLKTAGFLGKIITLGSLLNLITFTILLKLKKDAMAKGVIGAVLLLTLLTLFV